ncbi:MAG: T9SS type A sorting domain-containing protein, partial [Saprospiraceae bacterium]
VLNTTGIVEHAVDGVAAREFAPQANPHLLGGGIVEVYGRIRNCTNAVGLFYYQKDPKANTVSGAFLTLDNNYRGDAAKQPTLLYMRAQTRLDILGTWFYDFRTQGCAGSASRAKGLVADESAFQVRSSLFRNLDRGVQAYGKTMGFGTYTVENTSFFTCYTDIESNLPDNFRIADSYFHVGRPPMCPQGSVDFIGVRLFGYTLPMGIVLANNSFYGGDTESDTQVGTDCAGTGSMENFIRKNNFWDLDIGNSAAGNNGGFKGLRYECNEHYDNRFANVVNEGGSVRNVQGNFDFDLQSSTAAGNRFSGNGYTWDNDGAQITYYFWDTIGQVLTTGSGFEGVDTVRATFSNQNCFTYIHEDECPPPCPMEDSEVWQDSFFQHHTEWLATKAEYDNLTDTAAQAALLPEINAHRSAMDIWGGRVIRNFALDSTGTKVDSVLAWTERLQAYEADLRLARHAFFTGDFEGYDQWMEDIPQRNDLTERQSDELDDFAAVLAVVRPYAEDGTDLHRLPTTVLDSLEAWADHCDEPGFVAKVLLLGNGREAISACGGGSLRPPQATTTKVPGANAPIRLYPNPTTGQFFVELPEGSAPVRVQLIAPDGRTLLEQTLAASTELDGTGLRPGLYFCRVVDATGLRLVAKLII